MKVSSTDGDLVELEVANLEQGGGDLQLLVRIQRGSFFGEIDTWVQQTAWFGFAQELTILEERRHGEARLESISPGELSLVFRSLDRAGHLGRSILRS